MFRAMPRLASLVALLAVVAVSFTVGGCTEMRSAPADLGKLLTERAADTVESFRADKNLAQFADQIRTARAVAILPHVYKAGFILGAEGGNGVLIAKTSAGQWGAPAFYTLASGSVGFQVGLQDVEMLLIIRNEKALQAILKNQGKFGADGGITVGVFGAGMEASTTTAVGADVLAFARSRVGLYGGISLEGAALVRRKDVNEAAYGTGATPQAIVIENRFPYPPADRLRQVLAKQ